MGRFFRVAQIVVLCLGTSSMMTSTLFAQDKAVDLGLTTQQFGMPVDWSTPHVIYTANGSVENMMAVRSNPRFLNNFYLHGARAHRNLSQAISGLSKNGANKNEDREGDPGAGPLPRLNNAVSKVDWAVPLGTTAGMAFGESPAKYSFSPTQTPTCSDFVVYTINAAPKVGSQANLIGITNLYSGSSPTGACGTAPTFLFSYAIGSGGSDLSPTLSLDGTKVAWLENASNNHSILHVTTFSPNQGTNATTGSVAIGTSCATAGSCDVTLDYTNAPAGCPTSKATTNGDADMYIDYPTDSGFVAADNGILFHIKGVFQSGAPTVDFCITVNAGVAANAMSGSVYDEVLSPPEVFVSDSKTIYGYTVGATSFTLAGSFVYANGSPNDTGPGPVLDAFNNFIYIFSTHDKNGNTSMTQLPTSLASGVAVPLGPDSTNEYLFYGTPDNNYYTFGPKNAASTIYSCGSDATTTTAQDLFAISFNATTGIVNTTPAMPANKHANPSAKAGSCSPITEFYDGSTDRIFLGNGNPGATTGSNVVQMWNVTTQLTSATDTPTASATGYLGGTSGFTIDNNASGTAQAESIYFSTLTADANNTTGTTCGARQFCAVKLTQVLLQ
jgi:hypothetical protein